MFERQYLTHSHPINAGSSATSMRRSERTTFWATCSAPSSGTVGIMGPVLPRWP